MLHDHRKFKTVKFYTTDLLCLVHSVPKFALKYQRSIDTLSCRHVVLTMLFYPPVLMIQANMSELVAPE